MAHEVIVSPEGSFPEAANLYRDGLPPREWRALRAWFTTFYPFQLRWLLSRWRRAACVKSRQIGWSHTTAANAVVWGAFHGELTTVISKGEDESKEVLDKAKRHAETLVSLGSDFAEPVRSNTEELEFASGGRILALPSSGGRGFTGNVILDEFAYQQHQAKVWDAGAAVTMLGEFRLRVISTPNGTGDSFHNLTKSITAKKMKGWELQSVTINQAIEEGYPVNKDECWSIAKGDQRLFDQLFMCSFLDGTLQYIPSEAITRCSKAKISRHIRGRFYAGLDIGRTVDRTVLVVVFVDDEAHKSVQWIGSCKRTSPELLHAMVADAFRTFPILRLCVDSTGIGAFETDRLEVLYPNRVEGINFARNTKELLASALYSNLVHASVDIPADDNAIRAILTDRYGRFIADDGPPLPLEPGTAEALRTDLCALRRIITSAGNAIYDSPHTDEGHGDSAWALGLALHACSAPVILDTVRNLPDMRM